MAKKVRNTTIFRQLMLSIILPVIVALLALAFINYHNNKQALVEHLKEKNEIISDRIKGILQFQDFGLEIIESRLDERMQALSNKLANEYFIAEANVKSIDLDQVRRELSMDSTLEDIYVINENGIVVNTTFEKDLNLNLFKFGSSYEQYLKGILHEGKFIAERFSIEDKTKKLKKYSYQPTNDEKHIIELGLYSEKANDILDIIKKRLNNISARQASILSVELFIGSGAENEFSYNQDAHVPESHKAIMAKTFTERKSNYIEEIEDGIKKHYDYIFMDRNNSQLYDSAVIQVVSDRSEIDALLRQELIKFSIIFGVTILALLILTFNNAKLISNPIEKLLKKVDRITKGNLNERAEVEGNYEIAKLAQNFNTMINELEKSHNELEQRVIERTAEIYKQKEQIEGQKLELEQKNQDITDSIKYAKRIQEAILPPDQLIDNSLPESFVLYEPKDIVSGDFYWMANRGEDTYIAAVDCTGHGVPGAFMSMIGYNLLNQIVNEKGITEPSKILDELHSGVRKALKQDMEDSESRDGMDLALCKINNKKKHLEYSGAYRPLYLVRDNEIVETKGNKFAIGGQEITHSSDFTNHELKISKGDTFYIFSDGYADQFGGENSKKFMTKRFKNLLLDIQEKTLNEQKKVLKETIKKWRGSIRQIDDILVIGIRFN